MSEDRKISDAGEQAMVALWGFPKAGREQAEAIFREAGILCRFVGTECLSLGSYSIALYFWPDRADTAHMQLQMLRRANGSPRIPIIVVATPQNLKLVKETAGSDFDGLLNWPFTASEFVSTSRPFCAPFGAVRSPSSDARLLSEIANCFVSVINRTLGVTCSRGDLKMIDNRYSFRNAVVLSRLTNSLSGVVGITMSAEMADSLSIKLAGKKWLGESGTPDETGLRSFADQVSSELVSATSEGVTKIQCETGRIFRSGQKFGLDTRGGPFFAIEYFADDTPFEVLVCLRQKQGA